MKCIQYLNVNILKMKNLTNFIIFKNIILFLFNIIKKIKIQYILFCLAYQITKRWQPSGVLAYLQNPRSQLQILLLHLLNFFHSQFAIPHRFVRKIKVQRMPIKGILLSESYSTLTLWAQDRASLKGLGVGFVKLRHGPVWSLACSF